MQSARPWVVVLAALAGAAALEARAAGLRATDVTWSIAGGAAGGAVSPLGLYTAPASDGSSQVVATSVADPAVSGRAVVTVTSGGPVQESWVGVTAGLVNPHFDNGYAGAFDQSPLGRSDAFVVAGWDAGSPTELRVAYGVIGQAGPLPVARVPNAAGYGLDYGASCQDSVDHDLHVVYGTFGSSIQYWRLRPQRSGTGGAITGLTELAQFSIPGARYIDYPAIQEVTDGNGVRRLAIYGIKAVSSARADLALLLTTPAAGVAPAGAADFAGPNGEAAAVSIGSLPTLAYNCAVGLAQHRASRTLEVFMASGQHGATGPQRRVALAASGAGWSVGAPSDLPVGIGDAFAVQGLGDEVWFVWADPSAVHLSTVDSAGVVTLEAVPTPAAGPEDYRGPRHLALAPDGRLQVIWYLDSATPPRIRSNVFDGVTWRGWLDVDPSPGTIFNYLPLMGLAVHGGRLWSGTALSVGLAETAVTAASF
jgi:hypothetical protein